MTQEGKKKDNYKIYKYLILFGVIFVLVGLGLGTYFFSEYVADAKKINQDIGAEEYGSVAVIWIGALLMSGFALYEAGPFSKRSGRTFEIIDYIYKEHKIIFFGSALIGLLSLVTIALFVYYMFSEEEPLGMDFKRSCPPGTSYGVPPKHPTDIAS